MYYNLKEQQKESEDYRQPIYFLCGLYTAYVILWSLTKVNDLNIFSLSFFTLNVCITAIIFNRKLFNSYAVATCFPMWIITAFDIVVSFSNVFQLGMVLFHGTPAVISTIILFRKNTAAAFSFLCLIFASFYFLMLRNNGYPVGIRYQGIFMVGNEWLQILIILTSGTASILLHLLIKSMSTVKKQAPASTRRIKRH
jgi:hypothetical protein